MHLLPKDDITYPLMKDAIRLVPSDTVGLIYKILTGNDLPEVWEKDGKASNFPAFDECGDETISARKQELEQLISALPQK